MGLASVLEIRLDSIFFGFQLASKDNMKVVKLFYLSSDGVSAKRAVGTVIKGTKD